MSELKVFQWLRALIGGALGLAAGLWTEMTPESGLMGLILGAFAGIAMSENPVGGAVGFVVGYLAGQFTDMLMVPEIGFIVGMICGGIGFTIIGIYIGQVFGKDEATFFGYFGFIIGLYIAWTKGWSIGIIIGFAILGWLLGRKVLLFGTPGAARTNETVSPTQKSFQMSEANAAIKKADLTYRNAVSSGITVPDGVEKHIAEAQKAFSSEKYIVAKANAQDFLKGMEPFLKEVESKKAHQSYRTMEQVKTEMLCKDADSGIRFARLSLEKALEFGISPLEKERENLAAAQRFFDVKDYEKAIDLARSCKTGTDKLILESRPEIEITLPEKLQYNFWKQHNIIIKNKGTAHAREVSVNFPDAIKIRDFETIPLLKVNEQQNMRINIKPTEAGDVPVDYAIRFSDLHDRTYFTKHTAMITISSGAVGNVEEKLAEIGPDLKRGYEVLPNNDMRFGVRVENNSGFSIMDVQLFLDYPKSLLSLQGNEIQYVGNIDPGGRRTASFVLKPLGCIHKEKINGIVTYKDHIGNKHTFQMKPKEVHCVRPFLKEKPITENEYRLLATRSEFVLDGFSFKGISVNEMAEFIGKTSRHLLYRVKEYDIGGRKVFYLSGDALGENAYYLLTIVIQDHEGLTQVVLRAHSERKHGLNGFIREMADSIRHLVSTIQSAKEIGIIENTQVINIIDSVVQKTNFNIGHEGEMVNLNIKDSLVQRSDLSNNRDGMIR